MKRASSFVIAVFAVIVVCAGCGRLSEGSGPSAPGGGGKTDEFCRLRANMAANALKTLHEVQGSPGNVDQSKVVSDLLKDAPATQADLKAAAPAEPRKYLDALEKASANGDSGADAMVENIHALNKWSVENCPAKYLPVLKEYAGMGH
ncbi:hypothetical protein [Rudaea sp.]|uniref:hypothetical protein n=1 Tax=Rudaea sp. TaxID=2136325 RepID=UPI002ED364ED